MGEDNTCRQLEEHEPRPSGRDRLQRAQFARTLAPSGLAGFGAVVRRWEDKPYTTHKWPSRGREAWLSRDEGIRSKCCLISSLIGRFIQQGSALSDLSKNKTCHIMYVPDFCCSLLRQLHRLGRGTFSPRRGRQRREFSPPSRHPDRARPCPHSPSNHHSLRPLQQPSHEHKVFLAYVKVIQGLGGSLPRKKTWPSCHESACYR